jgi:hypothetical protein
LSYEKLKSVTNVLTGEKHTWVDGKRIIVEKRDPKNRLIHINVLTGERFIYLGGKKRILEKSKSK